MKFNATTFSASVQGENALLSFGFDLVDDSVTPNVIKASTSVSLSMLTSTQLSSVKTQVASTCTITLQDWYNNWKKQQAALGYYDAAALASYLNSHITF